MDLQSKLSQIIHPSRVLTSYLHRFYERRVVFSTRSTVPCEIGMSEATGKDYTLIVYLVERASRK